MIISSVSPYSAILESLTYVNNVYCIPDLNANKYIVYVQINACAYCLMPSKMAL